MKSLYNTTHWQKTRERKLRKNPLCEICLKRGKLVKASEIDHITPWREIESFFCKFSDLQSLCKSCHSRKTALEKARKAKQLLQKEPDLAKIKARKTKAYFF